MNSDLSFGAVDDIYFLVCLSLDLSKDVDMGRSISSPEDKERGTALRHVWTKNYYFELSRLFIETSSIVNGTLCLVP